MIPIKTPQEIQIMKESGRRLALVMEKTLAAIMPGVTLAKLDGLADSEIKKQAGTPSFKNVPGYKWATCININQGVVHGIPNEYRIKEGDLVSVDLGMLYGGFHTDMAWTLRVQTQSSKIKTQNDKFLEAGKKALTAAIKAAKVGDRVGHISLAIEKEIKKAGFSPIEALTGHGVGKALHEEPQIPCLLWEEINSTPRLAAGMTLAIEVIYSQGRPEVVLTKDNWTIETADGKLAGLFEQTVAITLKGPIILTG